jgi:hypothetical protein
MKKTQPLLPILAFCSIFLFGKSQAQTHREVVHFKETDYLRVSRDESGAMNREIIGTSAEIPLKPTGKFLAVSVVWHTAHWDEKTDRVSLGFQSGDGEKRDVLLHEDGHSQGETPNRHVSELYFLEENSAWFWVKIASMNQVDSMEVHFFDPGLTQPASVPIHPSSLIPLTSDRSACPCPQPAYLGRLDWCPDGSCPPDPTPEFVPNPTHIIIHHSAGPNVASDWAAVVRSFWDYHVNVNGWDDIGYNWLVDPNGVLYEGRGDGRLGAHFCAQNGNTIGICVIGDFTDVQPTDEAIAELEDYLAWDCCDKNISPLGTGFHSGSGLVLPFIAGHRDGCMTSCPGDAFYPMLPAVRQATQDRIDNGCGSGVLAAPTVLAITYVGYNKISLSWQDNAVGETGYAIERSETTDDNFSQIVQLPSNAYAFSDNSVSPDLTYFYRVRAKQGTEFSAYSNVAVAVTSLSATASRIQGGTASIYPNPTTGLLNLSIDNQWIGLTKVLVFDAMGRLAAGPFYEEKNSEQASFKLDLSGLPSGVFMLKMAQGDEAGWFRIVKN